jgi:hypothetical protein
MLVPSPLALAGPWAFWLIALSRSSAIVFSRSDNQSREPKEKGVVKSWLHEALYLLASPR